MPHSHWGCPTATSRGTTCCSHIRTLVDATDLPVNADFGSGFADDPGAVADNVRRCVATGVAGLSIEDATGRRATPLYELDVAAARVRAARQAIDESGDGRRPDRASRGAFVGDPDLEG